MDFKVGVIQKDTWDLFEQFISEDGRNNGEIRIGLTSDGATCGAIVGHFVDEELFKVDSFFVAPQARGFGGGALLIDTLLDQLHENDPLIAVKLGFLEMDEDTERLYDFLLARGYVEGESDKSIYLFSIEDFNEDRGFVTKEDADSYEPFEKVSKKEMLELDKKCRDMGIEESIFGSYPGGVDMHASIVLKNKGRNVSFITAEWVSENVCMFRGFHIPGGKIERFKNLMTEVIKRLGDKVDYDTQILIQATEDFEKKMLEETFPEVTNLYHSFVIA